LVDERLYVLGRGCLYQGAGGGKGGEGRQRARKKNCRAGKRQAGRGMFESVGKRESDQLGTNVRERGLGGVTGLPRYLCIHVASGLLDLYARTPSLSRARGVCASGAFTCHS
jgi:hypothetical protein